MSAEALLTILGMAAVTYLIRVSGLLLANRLPQRGFVAAFMTYLPGAVLAALVAPTLLLKGGPAEWLAALVVLGLHVLTRNLFVAMVGGVVAVFVARHFGLS